MIRRTQEEYLALVREIYGDSLTVLGQFVNNSVKIPHRCNKCNEIKLRSPYGILRSKRTRCCGQKPTTESYVAELEALGSTLRPTEPYRGRLTKINHRCSVCDTERGMTPNHLILGHGCFVCAKERQRYGYFERKTINIGERVFSLQGFEPQALQYMIDKGANPKYILTTVSEGKPTIKYRFERAEKTFIPDFYHKSKNRIVEVKSIWTLGLSKRPGGPFKKNAAKAKATIAAGYEFLVLLMDKKGRRRPLPNNWYNMTKAQVRRAVLT